MKKRILFIILLLFSIGAGAQNFSILPPTMILWQKGSHKISLKEAKYGINAQDSISITVYIHEANILRNPKFNNLTLEFRWYYYLSTRRSLMKIEKVNIKDAKKIKNGILLFKSTNRTPQPGWWEVQIINLNDKKYLQIGGINKYQIFIKK